MRNHYRNNPESISTWSDGDKAISRRTMLAGIACAAVAGGGEDRGTSFNPVQSPTTASRASSKLSLSPAPTLSAPSGAILVSNFYKPSDGKNYQPAFQAAIDKASLFENAIVYNDLPEKKCEMWSPVRRTKAMLTPDGVPLVVNSPMEIDFAGLEITLRGPTGGDRRQDIIVAFDEPWYGGWMYVIGNATRAKKKFGKISIKNVVVDGTYRSDFKNNSTRTLNDKGFKVHGTEVDVVSLYNVELRNFGGEIYYNGGYINNQSIINCHFHGSPQSAWNGCSTGVSYIENLKAGNAFIASEVFGGKGQTYKNCEFYDCAKMQFFGGPSPTYLPHYPYWYPYWDGAGAKPTVALRNVVVRNCGTLYLTCWVEGDITLIDTTLDPVWQCGDLHDINLTVQAICDKRNGYPALRLGGPPNMYTQVQNTPIGTKIKPAHDMNFNMTCTRSAAAIAAGRKFLSAIHFTGGLIDSPSITLNIKGEARTLYQFLSPAVAGFVLPGIRSSDFIAR